MQKTRKTKKLFGSSLGAVLVNSALFNTAFVAMSYAQDETLTLDNINVTTQSSLIGAADSASEGLLLAKRLDVPLLRTGEVLEQVPGLIVSQHSGSGKANQYYLRGFNLDHGTDFSISVEGTPVNMPTHAHGQGYADANFLIPELIENVTFRKGPYFADLGDFSSAGAVNINYYRSLPQSLASASVGENGYRRLLFAGSQATDAVAQGGQLLYALEAQTDDGVWDFPENVHKINGLLRYGAGTLDNGFNVTASAYHNSWNSTDQVPVRAIDSGLINRYGALDTSDGGNTHRYSLAADWHHNGWQANAYYIDYALNLFSNFTYFLDDPVNGDQFSQADKRHVMGGAVSRHLDSTWFGEAITQDMGLQTRYDDIAQVGLFHTKVRQRLDTTRDDSASVWSKSLWWQAGWQATQALRASVGLRADDYTFKVDSNNALNSGSASAGLVSSKLGVAWQLNPNTEAYFNAGTSFHSNDARGTTITVDPKTGAAADQVTPLVRTKGVEVGLRAKWLPQWKTSLSVFNLDVASELLFVGDAGATQASRPSRRSGVEWTNDYHPTDWLALDADFSLARSRFTDSDPVGSYIPGSIEKTASVTVTAGHELGWFSAAKLRYFGARPLIEDDSVRSKSTLIVNGRLGYKFNKNLTMALDVLNLFDKKVSDIDYFYTSRLNGESAAGVDDVHTHPAEPRALRVGMQYRF